VRCCALLHEGAEVVCGTNQGRAVGLVRASGEWVCLYRNATCQFTAVGLDEGLGLAVMGDARGGLSVVPLGAMRVGGAGVGTGGAGAGRGIAAYTFAAHLGHVMDVFFRRDAASGVPVVYSGDNADKSSGFGFGFRIQGLGVRVSGLGVGTPPQNP
jgi:hypothetical protein